MNDKRPTSIKIDSELWKALGHLALDDGKDKGEELTEAITDLLHKRGRKSPQESGK